MSKPRIMFISIIAVLCCALLFFWWNQSEKIDMAAYVPADALLYVEANSLTEIVQSVVATNAWKEIAPIADFKADSGGLGWLTRLAGWTGIGSHETVVFARAQVAICLLGFTHREEVGANETSLEITPRAVLIVETHTASWRVRKVTEEALGRFARRTLGALQAKRAEEGETTFFTWTAPADERKRLVAAVHGSLTLIGNDEASVRACLAVRRGERPSLAVDPELREMRLRMDTESSLAFGFAPSGSAAKVAEAATPFFASRASDNPDVQSVVAGLLPVLAHRVIGSAAWAIKFEDGAFIDTYFIRLPPSMTTRLANAKIVAAAPTKDAASYLPESTSQITFYNYQNPEDAWLALNASLSTQVETPHAPLVTLAIEAQLESYGIQSSREFLRGIRPEIATARIGSERSKVLIAGVQNQAALRDQFRQRYGDLSRNEIIGDVELLLSASSQETAIALTPEFLIAGLEEDIRKCIAARSENRTLSGNEAYKATHSPLNQSTPAVRTLTSEVEPVRTFLLDSLRQTRLDNIDETALRLALARLPYSQSETRITSEGWERRTRSAFGLLGTLVNTFGRRRDLE